MKTRTATLRVPVLCPENCGRELTVVDAYAPVSVRFFECACTDPPKRYRIPTIELEVIEPGTKGTVALHSAIQTGEAE